MTDDGPVGQRLIVCLEKEPRRLQGRHGVIRVLPLANFVQELWQTNLIG